MADTHGDKDLFEGVMPEELVGFTILLAILFMVAFRAD